MFQNLLLKLPKRELEGYRADPPTTEIGQLTGQMIGRGLRVRNIQPIAIFSSPALRSVQTAAAINRQLRVPLKIKVEPGLFESLNYYRKGVPEFLSPGELADFRLPIDLEYRPKVTYDDLKRLSQSECDSRATYQRLASVLEELLDRQPTGPVAVIGHAVTMDACASSLLQLQKQNDPLTEMDMIKIGLRYPYCSTVALEKDGQRWRLLSNALPTISYLDFNNRIDADFLKRIRDTSQPIRA